MKPSNAAMVLVFPLQLQQKMLFVGITNIKLYFLEVALSYISAL